MVVTPNDHLWSPVVCSNAGTMHAKVPLSSCQAKSAFQFLTSSICLKHFLMASRSFMLLPDDRQPVCKLSKWMSRSEASSYLHKSKGSGDPESELICPWVLQGSAWCMHMVQEPLGLLCGQLQTVYAHMYIMTIQHRLCSLRHIQMPHL